MVKTNLILCDVCKNKVGKRKCNLCDKDLCIDCVRSMGIIIRKEVNSGYFRNIPIVYCEDCFRKLFEAHEKNKNFFDDDFMGKLRKDVIDYIKKNLILESLKEEK